MMTHYKPPTIQATLGGASKSCPPSCQCFFSTKSAPRAPTVNDCSVGTAGELVGLPGREPEAGAGAKRGPDMLRLFILATLGATSQSSIALDDEAKVCQQKDWLNANLRPQTQTHMPDKTIMLNCTVELPLPYAECEIAFHWLKAGNRLINSTPGYEISNWSQRYSGENATLYTSSLLYTNLTDATHFGIYECHIQSEATNVTIKFAVIKPGLPSVKHGVAAIFVLILLCLIVTAVYMRCSLDLKLWYRDKYGDFEINDGKQYDAYMSYANADFDRKFVNLTLRPFLENRYGFRLHMDMVDLLPGLEPSDDLLMNVSRCRRLVIVLTGAYLEHEWCTDSFQEGLQKLCELVPRPIFIMFDNSQHAFSHPASLVLQQQKHRVIVIRWTMKDSFANSCFWKRLLLALPKKVDVRPSSLTGHDPQTMSTGDQDPMLTLNPDYLDCHHDVIEPSQGASSTSLAKSPVEPGASTVESHCPNFSTSSQDKELDISDLGARNYDARKDFYCLVTEEEI
uniref:Single immunoglobulin and toll-interleukin 1 receptor (TIR) domain n=1 Tax=Eptatretus burgeri TaxID=7764 RepID=A0A8C4R853_EPTBU